MAVTYTPTTNFGAKDSLPQNDPDKVIKGTEFTTEFTAIQTAFSLAATAASPTFTGTATLPSVDINGGTIDGTSIGASSKSSGAFTSLEVFATSPSLLLTETDITDKNTKLVNGGGNFFIQEISNDGLTSVNRIKLDHTTGNMTFYDDTSAGTVLFLDAVNNRAGINTINPASTLDVNGTVTADGLTVEGTSPKIFLSETDKTDLNARVRSSNGFFQVQSVDDSDANPVTRFQIEHATGDISFYEDTGTTPKFFWDASAEALGIGTTSPSGNLHVDGGEVFFSSTGDSKLQIKAGNTSSSFIEFGDPDDGNVGRLLYGHSDNSMQFTVNASERMRITSAGNVGIGTSSPSTLLELSANNNSAASNNTLRFTDTDTATEANQQIGKIEFKSNDSSGDGALVRSYILSASEDTTPSSYISFGTNPGGAGNTTDERMRIDSSGNLLVGKSASNYGTEGVEIRSNEVLVTNDGGTTLSLNRLSSDGTILGFAKDGGTVGSIGSYSNSYLYIGSEGGTDTHIAFVNGSVRPSTNDGSLLDNVLDLGNASARWDDVFATNGTIQTSDANEKQDIRDLSEAEARVAQAAKALLKAFRWKDSVAEKGDDARIHFGIIAQDLQAAFEAEGLDAGRYAMFIHSTWTDEETGEERSRMGVRYSELLAFIIAAL